MAVTEQFSLRWNNFHSNITNSFHELLEAAEMVDVTLAVDGQYLQAHKIVLSICSPYFKEMFKLNPCKHPIVILKDVCHENMKDILEFMYMGEVNVLRENLSSFLRTAELLQVKGLTGDDSSDTSSKKDEKLECDNEDDNELLQYNQMIEQEVELPNRSGYPTPNINIPSPLPTHTQQIQSSVPPNLNPIMKRQSKYNTNSQSNSKRPKSEASTNQTKSTNNKPSIDQQMDSLVNNTNKFDEESEFIDSNNLKLENIIKNEKMNVGIDFNDSKEESKQILEFGGPGSTDNATGETDIKFTADGKGHVYCPYCFRKFVNRYNLKVHIRDKHEDSQINLDCVICGKTMRNRSCLRVHMYHHRKQQLEIEQMNNTVI